MCGIAGVIRSATGPIDARFALTLEHRGPDDRGWLLYDGRCVTTGRDARPTFEGRLLLWHQRLSIIDLSPTGWQPMAYGDGRWHIVFNGEIYNYLELKQELEAAGCRFKSTSDTEVLLAGYATWGKAMLRRLTGMFAFAIFDQQTRRVFLARDPFGIKPLYYTQVPSGLAFASEIKALVKLDGVPRRANPQRVYDYLQTGLGEAGNAETFYRDIQQLPGAHCAEIDLDTPSKLRCERYWQIDPERRTQCSFAEAVAQIRNLFLENIRLHLRSDVTVGSTLSGGIDSSSVVSAVRHLHPAEALHTFSLVVPEAAVNEEPWINIVAEACRTQQHKTTATAEGLFADIGTLIYTQDEPFGGTSMYGEYCIHRLIRQAGLKVVLVGDGGDEIFAGYQAFLGAYLASLTTRGRLVSAARFARVAARFPGMNFLRVCAYATECSLRPDQQRGLRALLGKSFFPPWMKAGWFEAAGVEPTTKYVSGGEKLRALLVKMLTESALPGHLRCQDRNSMAHSIESRQPFLTPNLVEFVLSLPEEFFFSSAGGTKHLLREAMRGLLPEPIRQRRDKIGFATNEATLLRQHSGWVEQAFRSDRFHTLQALAPDVVMAQWSRVRDGAAPYDGRVWRWLNLVLWADRFDVTF